MGKKILRNQQQEKTVELNVTELQEMTKKNLDEMKNYYYFIPRDPTSCFLT